MMPRRKVLVTGVYGLVGNIVYRHLSQLTDRFEVYGLDRQRIASERARGAQLVEVPRDKFFQVDLADSAAVGHAVEGMDMVVHLAADPRPEADWNTILPSNVIGVYHVFEACRQAGVKRVVYASSLMAMWGHMFSEPCTILAQRFPLGTSWEPALRSEIPLLTHLSAPQPNDLYGASKVWGEALARVYAAYHYFSCLCVRFGTVYTAEAEQDDFAPLWCSHRDAAQIIERCLEAPETLSFDIFYAVSDGSNRLIDLEHSRTLIGYVPLDGSSA